MHSKLKGVRLGVTLGIAAVALAACTSGSGSAHHSDANRDDVFPQRVPARVTLRIATVAGLGRVLVDGSGRALYLFPPDASRAVTCTGPCAGTWPPLVVGSRAGIDAGAGVDKNEVGTVHDPNTGALDVTYAGHPLYRYAGDLRAGTANGQGLELNGGPWYVLDAAGEAVLRQPAGAQ